MSPLANGEIKWIPTEGVNLSSVEKFQRVEVASPADAKVILSAAANASKGAASNLGITEQALDSTVAQLSFTTEQTGTTPVEVKMIPTLEVNSLKQQIAVEKQQLTSGQMGIIGIGLVVGSGLLYGGIRIAQGWRRIQKIVGDMSPADRAKYHGQG
jgi:hypothetical protein